MLDYDRSFLIFLDGMACLSVSQLNEAARESLQACFESEIWVKGEVQGYKYHAKSGHIYFDLVEKSGVSGESYVAKVSCAFFRGPYVRWRAMLASAGIGSFELNSGIEVKLRARIDLFVKEGRYQLIVSEIDPSYTLGAIAKKREQTIQALRTQGLLDRNKGISFPEFPLNIGLITSDGSAAHSDFMRIISDSGYCFSITLFDAHMQGENTVPEVMRGISALERHPRVDSIVIIRGGGAKTDLFSFDDMALCTAVARCSKPVVTGIGHEIDISVSDMAAHTYRVTPTDVARVYVSKADELWSFLSQASREIALSCGDIMQHTRERLRNAATGLRHVTRQWMISAVSELKEKVYRIRAAIAGDLAGREQSLMQIRISVRHHADRDLVHQGRRLGELARNLAGYTATMLADKRESVTRRQFHLDECAEALLARNLDRMNHLDALLAVLDPVQTLRRGFSITVDGEGRMITDAGRVAEGETITTRLLKGKIRSVGTDKET
ncbi:exodeoxyribonuclease VII large subunit, partial [bacterium]|nr:exodeoxyribonuclease VII large subunit [bacterium]